MKEDDGVLSLRHVDPQLLESDSCAIDNAYDVDDDANDNNNTNNNNNNDFLPNNRPSCSLPTSIGINPEGVECVATPQILGCEVVGLQGVVDGS